MHIARRLSEAIGSWLHYEFCCYRAGLFSEDSLKAAVGGVLSSFPIITKGARVYANFPHESLNPLRKAGRKREVDFALILAGAGLPKKGAQIVVETKWAGSSHCRPENIFQDFLRLAAIKRDDPNATCIFLLAGNERDVSSVLQNMPFRSEGKTNCGIRSSGRNCRLTLDPSNTSHRSYFGDVIGGLSSDGFKVPESFVSRAHGLHPRQTDVGTVDFQAIAWEVLEISSQFINPTLWS
ncbi:hypothetical protein [Ideonella livida]|uniref:Uncharacterized protein n=1 Tax=Ideonella livida TaxID=2707176 RepID=A0A7C9TIP1_9BURK|nr:hypothetical protein [Ideonella livida]NDY91218.1 hypothetical protein [Ideonella livida]